MRPYEIYQRISPELSASLLSHLLENDKPAYKATLQALANQRHLRLVFLERKPRPERHTWMQQALGQKVSDEITQNLLQFWLLTAQTPLLTAFLDGLGVEHDGKGAVEELPPAPEKEKLRTVISSLLETHPREVVAVYLHAFQSMDISGWSTLAELLAEDERLHLPVK